VISVGERRRTRVAWIYENRVRADIWTRAESRFGIKQIRRSISHCGARRERESPAESLVVNTDRIRTEIFIKCGSMMPARCAAPGSSMSRKRKSHVEQFASEDRKIKHMNTTPKLKIIEPTPADPLEALREERDAIHKRLSEISAQMPRLPPPPDRARCDKVGHLYARGGGARGDRGARQ